MPPSQLLIDVTQLQNMLVAHATGGSAEDREYKELREKLLNEPVVKDLLPDFVHMCRDLSQFWGFIKQKEGRYQPRRDFLWAAFRPALEAAEKGSGAPVHEVASETLDKLDAGHVSKLWRKALARTSNDPEGAITAARALVESVCKLVLDTLGVEYDPAAELPKLYKTAAQSLNLGVDQHQQQVFKQILSGIGTTVEGLAAVRNKLGDAHGPGLNPVKPAVRHAQLAVNLAGPWPCSSSKRSSTPTGTGSKRSRRQRRRTSRCFDSVPASGRDRRTGGRAASDPLKEIRKTL